jgi:segregation and condensation protein B
MIAEDVTPSQRLAVIEALLFCNPAPMRLSELEEVCGWNRELIERDLERLAEVLAGRGIELQRVAGAVRLVSVPEAAPFIEKMLKLQSRRRLSRSQLETLAVVAYKQPVTRAQVESYRGVKSERPLSQLMELRLIREVGRAPLPGKPCQYGTTAEFLRHFGLNDLKQLPTVEGAKPRSDRGPFSQLGLDDSGEERLVRELNVCGERAPASEEGVVLESREGRVLASGESVMLDSREERVLVSEEGGAVLESREEHFELQQSSPGPFGADSGEETPGFRQRSHLEGPSAELRKLFERIRKKSPEP